MAWRPNQVRRAPLCVPPRRLAWLIGAALGIVAGWGAIDPDAKLCAVGAADCACTMGGGCDPGLRCEEGTCIDPAVAGTDGSGDGSGTDSGDTGDDTPPPPTDGPDDGGSETGMPPAGPNYAFITSTRYTAGAIGGLAGADDECQQHADDAGLPGTYVAWLSLPGNDARDRLGPARGWVRPDDKPLAGGKQQVVDGRFFYPPILDEQGTLVAPDAIWTGTAGDGTAYSLDALEVCSGWTSDDPSGVALVGDLGAGPGWWTGFSSLPCDQQARLACFGIDQQYDVVVEPVDGRHVFVSNGLLQATSGRDAADTMCQTEADAAGYSGDFLALLAVNGEAPGDRFNLSGPPWVRWDGIAVFKDGEPLGPELVAPLLYDAMGNPSLLAIGWAGSYGVSDPGTDSSDCTNWSATTGIAGMFNMIHIYWQGWNLGGGGEECAQGGYSVVCLEQ